MQVMLLGGHGYVGRHLVAALEAANVSCLVLRRREVDYYQADKLAGAIRDRGADFLINAAGYTGRPNVDACERHKSSCLLGNAVLPAVVREACERTGVALGHVSSGCIYTGTRADGMGFQETDPPNFCFRTNHCSFYSGCKALGEEILAGFDSCYLWRLRIPFSHQDGPRNYLSKLLRYPRLLDARNSLSQLNEFATACVDSLTQGIPFGVYNLTNGGSITTREVVRMMQATIAPNREFNFFTDEAEFMRTAAVAPRSNCVLDNGKAIKAGLRLSPIDEALQQSMARWQPESSQGAT